MVELNYYTLQREGKTAGLRKEDNLDYSLVSIQKEEWKLRSNPGEGWNVDRTIVRSLCLYRLGIPGQGYTACLRHLLWLHSIPSLSRKRLG